MSKFDGVIAFPKNELVYAKIRGYPWWPGIIAQVKLKSIDSTNDERKYEYLVNFIGDNSHSLMSEDKIQKFSVKEVDLKDKKRKKLMESIAIANDIHLGKYTYKEWRKENEQRKRQKRRKNKQTKQGGVAGEPISEEESSSTSSSGSDESDDTDLEEQENIVLARALSLSESVQQSQSQHEKSSADIEIEEEDVVLPRKKTGKLSKSHRSTIIDDSEEDKIKPRSAAAIRSIQLPPSSIQSNQSAANNSSSVNSKQLEQKPVIETEDDEEEIEVFPSGLASNDKHLNLSAKQSSSHIPLPPSNPQSIIATATPLAFQKTASQPDSSQPFNLITQPSVCQLNSKKHLSINASATLPTGSNSKTEKKPTKPALSRKQTSWSVSTDSGNKTVNQSKNNNNSRVRFGDEVEGKSLNSEIFELIPYEAKPNCRVTRASHSMKPLKRTKAPIISQKQPQPEPSSPTTVKKQKTGIAKKQKQAVPKRTRCKTMQIERESQIRSNRSLEMEFTSFFSQLSSACDRSETLGENLSVIAEIIRRIRSWQPCSDNILEILKLDYGKLLMCVMNMCFADTHLPYYQAAVESVHRDRFLSLRAELQKLLNSLSSALFQKFFDHEEKMKVLQTFNTTSTIPTTNTIPTSSVAQLNPQSPPSSATKISSSWSSLPLSHSTNTTPTLSEPNKLDEVTPEKQKVPSASCEIDFQNLSEEQKILRRKICLKIMKPLREMIKDQSQLQSYAKQIEVIIRRTDPQMQTEYKAICRDFITFISAEGFTTTADRIEEYIGKENPKQFNILLIDKTGDQMQNEQLEEQNPNTNNNSHYKDSTLTTTAAASTDIYSLPDKLIQLETTNQSSPKQDSSLDVETKIEEEDIHQQENPESTASGSVTVCSNGNNTNPNEHLTKSPQLSESHHEAKQTPVLKSENDDACATTFLCFPITASASNSSNTNSILNPLFSTSSESQQ